MPLRFGLIALFLLASACFAGRLVAAPPKLVAETPPLSPDEQLKKFHLPPGFRIELIAAEPDVPKPINLNFDAAGRLYATCSLEYPWPAEGDATPRDAIKLILDADGNGVPDKVTTFAGGLNIPIGVTPVDGGVLGYSIPSIRRFPDADGDGRADRQEVAYAEFGFQDTHGMASSFTWWVDGWVYACHGFANTSTVSGEDGEAVTMQSGNTYRLRPDGSRIEQYTWGQVNPFGLTIDPLGNIFTSDCHSRPIYMLLRGAYYPSFGKPHDGLGFGPEIMQHSHGSTGIAGVVYYAADQFPPEYRGTMFVGNPVTGIINHDRLETHGASYRAIELPDFLTCDDPWFRPVDLQLAPDGSLYVADFYNAIIGHYEVPLEHPKRDRERGRIWRISYVGTDDEPLPKQPARDLTSATAEELLECLAHPNLVVRTHATHQLVHRIGEPAVELVKALAEESTAEQRAHGLWVLARLGALDDAVVRRLASDPERLVRVHLVKALAERSQWTDAERQLVLETLADSDAFVRRAAADAVGRHPHPENVGPLLRVWRDTPADDPQLIHTIRIALRDTVQALESLPGLSRQFQDAPFERERLAEISLGIRSAHAAAFLMDRLREQSVKDVSAETLHHVGRYGDQVTVAELHAWWGMLAKLPPGRQHRALLALHRAARERDSDLPHTLINWGSSLAAELLRRPDPAELRKGIELARELRLRAAAEPLADIAGDRTREAPLRTEAMLALLPLDRPLATRVLERVLASPDEAAALRQGAAQALGSLNTDESRAILVAHLKIAPQELAVAIARGLAGSEPGAQALLAAAEQGTVALLVLQDSTVQERLRALEKEDLTERVQKLVAVLPPADERLQALIAARREGFHKGEHDPSRGAAVFKKNCAACHRIGSEGTKVGPELDGIGVRGLDRLLEDVLDPNRNVDAAFRATVLALADGRVLTGLVVREEGTTLVLVDERGQEHRIARDEIEVQRKSTLSAMPANVSELVIEDEFYDLMAWLLQQRQIAAGEPVPAAGTE